jgi:hypothetical protein
MLAEQNVKPQSATYDRSLKHAGILTIRWRCNLIQEHETFDLVG